MIKYLQISLLIFLFSINLTAQIRQRTPFLAPADSLNKTRFWSLSAAGAVTYTAVVIGLNEVWYKGYPRSPFHLFNDTNEWEHIDKTGHFITPYHETRACFYGGRWTGLNRKQALWTAFGLGMLFQTTIEIMDGYSEKWGFSIPDMAFNTAGCALFAGQELLWREQRIMPKVSSMPRKYPTTIITSTDGLQSITLDKRAKDLYGTGAAEVFLKDYNALNAWVSVNVSSFLPKEKKFPKWLNIAVGYGADNLYAGYNNSWIDETTGREFVVDPIQYPIYRQYYLSFDVDWTRIHTNNRFLKTLFLVLNVIKTPSPTLEYNSLGKLKFHPLFF